MRRLINALNESCRVLCLKGAKLQALNDLMQREETMSVEIREAKLIERLYNRRIILEEHIHDYLNAKVLSSFLSPSLIEEQSA